MVTRVGGDEFAAFAVGPLAEDVETVLVRLDAALATTPPPAAGVTEVRMTMGVALADPRKIDLDGLLSAADADMYRRRADTDAGAQSTAASQS